MNSKNNRIRIYWLATICLAMVLTLGCERESLYEPALSSHEMAEGISSGSYPLSIPQGERFLIGFHREPDINLIMGVGGEVYKTFTIVPAVAARLSPRAVEALEKNPRIRYIEPDHEVFAHSSQTVPWGIDRVFGAESHPFGTWGITKGSGIAVAILDTGIDGNHEDLTVKGGVTTVDDTHWGYDGNGHGTHVAGTVAALDNTRGVVGVAPAVDLYAVKVLSNTGSGNLSSVIAGIEWAVIQSIPVLNMSLGSSSSSTTLMEACSTAYSRGHLLVASAGNSGNPGGRGDNVGYPAAYEWVIAVAASTANDTRASYSSTGPAVELIAPGSGILSTEPGNKYGTKSGTSMASPHVAGVAALVKAANTGLTNAEIRQILRDSAEDLGLSSNHQGYGLARADLAVSKALGVDPPATGSIDGTVTDEAGAIAGATVVVEGTSFLDTTDENGTYSIGNVPTGEQKVTASAEGYYSETATVKVIENEKVIQNFTLNAIPPTPTWTVSGAVLGNGSLLGGATVTIKETGQTATTGNDGNYSISGVEAGTYDITASKEGYSSQTKTEKVEGDITINFTLEKEAETSLSIDKFELTNTSNPAWARVSVDWTVSGSNIKTVKSEMFLNGIPVDSATSSVSGSSASGSHELRNRGGSGQTYSVILTVTDDAGYSVVSEPEYISL
jgi:subtilisin